MLQRLRSYVAEVFEKEIAEDERILALMLYQEAETDQLYESISEFGRYRGSKSAFFRAHEEDEGGTRARLPHLGGYVPVRTWTCTRGRAGREE